ncbi:MAG: formimidoylglutamase [Tatlockia sp.]|nr:formimidoylglutamase [Tatlockia sp.]
MLADLFNYKATEPSLWQGRKDSLLGERFFQQVKLIDLSKENLTKTEAGTVILGFCSDEGIRRNEGRPGANLGPLQLRKQLAKLAYHSKKQLIDIGNIVCDQDLEKSQEEFSKMINHCHQLGYKTLAFGGGHEIAFGHFCGLTSHYPKLGIINFDTHFDLRPCRNNYSTSGTPFRQIASHCLQHNWPFNYCCLGIQKAANTRSLFDQAEELNVSYLTSEQINQESFAWQCAFLDNFILNVDYIYLSLCLDVFSESFAPGVSSPQPLGLTPWQALPLLKYILQNGKVVSLDIAELSPPLDEGQKTARLAASLLAELLDYF